MFDQPHKLGPDALKELRSLSPETRRHMLGLFEQHTEGLTIFLIQIVASFIYITYTDRPILIAWGLYFAFSVFWVVRSIGGISAEIYGSFTKEELRANGTYRRYCDSGWFLRTIGGLILATICLVLLIWLFP